MAHPTDAATPAGEDRSPAGHRLAAALVPAIVAWVVVVGLGAAFRAPCIARHGDLTFSLKRLCYTDVYPLYFSEGLNERTVPYAEARPDGRYMEYPVLTGGWMYAIARAAPEGDASRYFWYTQAGFGLLAAGGAACLGLLAGARRALLLAAAPTLLLLGGISWDLLAVAPLCGALLAFSRRRDGPAGLLLGLGAAAKLYPVIVLPALALQRLREGDARGAARLAGVTVATVVAVNAPVALAARRGWEEFFRLNRERGADWDSVWFHLERWWGIHVEISMLNLLTFALFLAGAAGLLVWQWRRAGRGESAPGIDRATAVAALACVAWFLLVNKVWSPQYGVWLLPLWVVLLPATRRAVAVWLVFQALDVFVLVTRFWSPEFAGRIGREWFSVAVFTRLGAFVALLAVLLAMTARRSRVTVPEVAPA